MSNPKEKIFILMYDTLNKIDDDKLHKFIDELGAYKANGDNSKYLHWAKYCGFYTLSTLENTYWDANKLSNTIHKYMDNNITHIIFEVQNVPVQGRMPEKYWKFWKQSQDLTSTIQNYTRSKKLKKLTNYINKKKELEQREKEIENKKIELKKALYLKNKEEELKKQEKELEEMEKQLLEPIEKENTPKVKKRWFNL
jgi:hypothetical protein